MWTYLLKYTWECEVKECIINVAGGKKKTAGCSEIRSHSSACATSFEWCDLEQLSAAFWNLGFLWIEEVV